jgi:hypothetical protein
MCAAGVVAVAADLLGWAADLLADDDAPVSDIRFLADRLAMSLREVHRVAESRGAPLAPAPVRGRGRRDRRRPSGLTTATPLAVRRGPARRSRSRDPHRGPSAFALMMSGSFGP